MLTITWEITNLYYRYYILVISSINLCVERNYQFYTTDFIEIISTCAHPFVHNNMFIRFVKFKIILFNMVVGYCLIRFELWNNSTVHAVFRRCPLSIYIVVLPYYTSVVLIWIYISSRVTGQVLSVKYYIVLQQKVNI